MMSLAWPEQSIPSNDDTKPSAEQGKIKVYLEHYGCTANRFDTEVILGILEASEKFELVDSPESADIAVINTCIVKGPTQRKMEKRINFFLSKNLPVVIAGCFGQALKEYLLKKYADKRIGIVGPYALNKIDKAILETLEGKRPVYTDIEVTAEEKLWMPKKRLNPIVGILLACDGCLGSCSYCIVRLARGWLMSPSKEKLVKYAKHMVEKEGVKEIFLTAQDTGVCGLDRGYKLADLIRDILRSTDAFFKLRIGMMNPQAFLMQANELLELFESDERLYRFLHLPVQSGSDKVLRDMKRMHTAEDFVEAVKMLREFDPLFNVITDIIVGFPTETEEDFQETIKLLKYTKPDNVFLSRFELRPYTHALEFKILPGWVTKRRSRELVKIIHKIAEERNKLWIGKTTRILVDKEPDARNDYYKLVITGNRFKPGEYTEVKIRRADNKHLYI